jgi:hypothetical protein
MVIWGMDFMSREIEQGLYCLWPELILILKREGLHQSEILI